MAKSSPKGKKTLWELEKLLFTCNNSFSHSVFKNLILQTRKNKGLFGKGLSQDCVVKTGGQETFLYDIGDTGNKKWENHFLQSNQSVFFNDRDIFTTVR